MNLAYKLDLDMVKLNHCVSVKGQFVWQLWCEHTAAGSCE